MTDIILEDESLRDGLQFEKQVVPLEQKQSIFNQLGAAGIKRIQVGSFVNPKVLPQMADTDTLVGKVRDTQGPLITGLVLNARGLQRALACGLGHISLSASASDTHSQKNVRKSSHEAVVIASQLIKEAVQAGVAVRAGIQCAFGCVGVRIFDTSAGGLGGCPFVKGAAGNVPSEDAAYLFESMGVETGIDLVKLCEVTNQYEHILGRELPGRMGRVLNAQSFCAA